MNDLARLILKDGRQKSLLRRHPWVFSGAIARVEGEPQTGVTVAVQDAHGEFMALAAYSPASQIRARVWSWSPEELPDADFFRQRIQQSVLLRQPLLAETNAVRLVHAESDGLPGLVVDQFGDVLEQDRRSQVDKIPRALDRLFPVLHALVGRPADGLVGDSGPDPLDLFLEPLQNVLFPENGVKVALQTLPEEGLVSVGLDQLPRKVADLPVA